MAKLRTEHPATTEAFAAMCAQRGFPLPWRYLESGALVAADETVVADVDPDWLEADLGDGVPLGALIELAINTCGGFNSEQPNG